ncbi:serine O-acetyltransferase [Agarivorans gilvus]|uniref:Serine acetyltransferase n=1 Tax=Agarivorans gilvus TaxID=680279 RepID=A0ABQ1I546_9ALTE|nr:serine acetyltransferase [Agarivorans gilvus]GGB12378.1 serine acetyltransferase [Agarivorans gilvus]
MGRLSVKQIIYSDLYRYYGEANLKLAVMAYFKEKGFRFTFWLRLAAHWDKKPIIRWLPKLMFMYQKRSLVSDINYRATIGPGFCIRHVFGTTFGAKAIIGKNVTITHNVTIGGRLGAYPIIGDNVYIGPGASVLGAITIANNAIIGSNAVVTKDVPESGVVVGNPGKLVSTKGSRDYIEHPYSEE